MVVKTLDRQGNGVLIFDPSAVYLDQAELDETQARFRIFGQARLRRHGLRIVQDKDGDDIDYLIYKGGEIDIPLEIVDDIITVKTLPVALTQEQREGLTEHMEKIIRGVVVSPTVMGQEKITSLILNEANLTKEERSRLIHRWQAHRQSGEGKIHENCPICEEGKKKQKGSKEMKNTGEWKRRNFQHIIEYMQTGMEGNAEWARKATRERREDLSLPVRPLAPSR